MKTIVAAALLCLATNVRAMSSTVTSDTPFPRTFYRSGLSWFFASTESYGYKINPAVNPYSYWNPDKPYDPQDYFLMDFTTYHFTYGKEKRYWKYFSSNNALDVHLGFENSGYHFNRVFNRMVKRSHFLAGIGLQSEYGLSWLKAGPSLTLDYAQFYGRKDSWILTPSLGVTLEAPNRGMFANLKIGRPIRSNIDTYASFQWGVRWSEKTKSQTPRYTDDQWHQRQVQQIAHYAEQQPECTKKLHISFMGSLGPCKDAVASINAPRTAKYKAQVFKEYSSRPFTTIKTPLPAAFGISPEGGLLPLYGRTSYESFNKENRSSQSFDSWHLSIDRAYWLSKNWMFNPAVDLQFGAKRIDGKNYYSTGLDLQSEFGIWLLNAGPALAVHYVQFPDRKDSVLVTPCVSVTCNLGAPYGFFVNWKGGLPLNPDFKHYNSWNLGMQFSILDKKSRDGLKNLKKEIENEIREEMACFQQANPISPCP